MTDWNLIVILGPTASGKTRLAAKLAANINSEIISADSRQVYRQMNIGTGKDYQDYIVDGSAIPYHLIDIAEAGSKYHIDRYKKDFFKIFDELHRRGVLPVMCGGTGLYINAVLSNFEYTSIPNNVELRDRLEGKSREELLHIFLELPDTTFKLRADTSTAKRLLRAIEISNFLQEHEFAPVKNRAIRPLIVGLNPDVELRRERIAHRLRLRLKSGLIEEVKDLLAKGISTEQLIYYGLEYKFVTQYLMGEMSYAGLEELLTIAIQQYAKRQMTYFRKMEKDGHIIHWIDMQLPPEEQLSRIIELIMM